MGKKVIKPSQWMKTIGVGRMGDCYVKKGHENKLVFNKHDMARLVFFIEVCMKLGWQDDNWNITRVFNSPKRFVMYMRK